MIAVAASAVIDAMKEADGNGRRGVRGPEHYAWAANLRDNEFWVLDQVEVANIHAIATQEPVPPFDPALYAPVVVTSNVDGVMIAQDGNHRIVAARAAGIRTLVAYVRRILH